MSGLQLYTSNRLEILADLLKDTLAAPLPSPMDEEIVVVQSRGMERWLSMELARRQGICANVVFPFPNAFVNDLFQKVLYKEESYKPCDCRSMVWKIVDLLPGLTHIPEFVQVKDYLGNPVEPLRLFQLSACIADLFDQYLLFRPEMMLQWENTTQGGWQGGLWRTLIKDEPPYHRARLALEFFEKLKNGSLNAHDFPHRMSIFGISALPRFHMEILSGVSQFCPVYLFMMNPCQEYWSDIVSNWEMKRVMDREGDSYLPEDLHLEKGNSLLASMGGLGRDFFDLIHHFSDSSQSRFENPVDAQGQDTMLTRMQSDILLLREGRGLYDAGRTFHHDDSIQIHTCHSPMREIEVLYDQLLHMFDSDEKLLPKDVLVMAPDIEVYAPFIQSVFHRPHHPLNHGEENFPFSIADRGVRRESRTIDTFLSMLDLSESRLTAPEVLSLLDCPSLRKTFHLAESDLPMVQQWVVETGIRWGLDGNARREMALPPFEENTWNTGIERLLLGYALPGKDKKMFQGILPYDCVEGETASVLGRAVHFFAKVFAAVQSLKGSHLLGEWSRILEALVTDFFQADHNEDGDVQTLRTLFREMKEAGETWRVEGSFEFRMIHAYLRRRLERTGAPFGYISGGITFCSMLPMRSIPFKVVCLLGMNGDAYPRDSKPLSFDLMAQKPQAGDRSRRDDDRYLFLETILSAREKLYISYVGQSIRDNTPIPPSVMVSELIDYIEQTYQITENRADGEKDENPLVVQHRLQPFSPEYFKEGSRLFSYSRAGMVTAENAMHLWEKKAVPFLSEGLSAPDETWRYVDVAWLRSFFVHPARHFLFRRLGIDLRERTLFLDDREPFELKGLEKYLLENRVLQAALEGGSTRDLKGLYEEIYEAERASGRLPHGIVGKCAFDDLFVQATSFAEKTKAYLQSGSAQSIPVDLSVAGFTITGQIPSFYPKGLVAYRYARLKPKDYLAMWLNHLVLTMIHPDGFTGSSYLIGLDPKSKKDIWACWEYVPNPQSEVYLSSLLDIYWDGLTKPIRFFPRSSWKYAWYRVERGASKEESLEKALKEWTGDRYSTGESDDEHFACCFRSMTPLDATFESLAVDILSPLFEGMRKVDL